MCDSSEDPLLAALRQLNATVEVVEQAANKPVAKAEDAVSKEASLQQAQTVLIQTAQRVNAMVQQNPHLTNTRELQTVQGSLNNAGQTLMKTAGLNKALVTTFRGAASRQLQKCQLCWVIDGTSSMGPHMDMVKAFVSTVTRSLSETSALQVAVGYVVYRDHGDGRHLYSVCDFSDVQTFLDKFQHERASGGADIPEEALGGLQQVCEGLSWRPECIAHPCVWIADAPAHGYANPGTRDDHPNGHPSAPTLEAVVSGFRQRSIDLMFLEINDTTKRMMQAFEKAFGGIQTYPMKEIQRDPANWLTHITRNSCMQSSTRPVTGTGGGGAAASAAAASMYSTGATATGAMGATGGVAFMTLRHIDRIPANWEAGSMQELRGIPSVAGKANDLSTDDLINLIADFARPLENIVKKDEATVLVAPGYFSDGSVRFARCALVRGRPFVAKDYKHLQMNNMQNCLAEMRCTLLADVLANSFRSRIPGCQFRYITTFVMQMTSGVSDPPFSNYFAFEEFADGTFSKFNNNNGVVDDVNHPLAQAFSHFTFHRSGGKYMVCDLQGIKASETDYLLTDPAILTPNPDDFPFATNMGQSGIDAFFRAHKCNKFCKMLELSEFGLRN